MMRSIIQSIFALIAERFSLDDERAQESEIIASIKKGVEFKGVNVWVLVFAIFIASIGLNVNSTAVIIGAMLISPLMGPIMGLGLSLGILDFELLKKAAKNLAIMVGISLTTSTIYFWLSPLSQAQSELLARTQPTIWDVFIALFGGLAGIIAGSTKDKGNAIPGVAIATALMPPLCTAGYGIATAQFFYTLGAFYLFTINAIFISVSTFVVVRFMNFSPKTFVDKNKELQIRRYLYVIIFVTVVPSVYLAYDVVRQTVFEHNVSNFVQKEFVFDNTKVISFQVNHDGDQAVIEVYLIGEPIDKSREDDLKKDMANYKLGNASLVLRQGIQKGQDIDMGALRANLLEDFYKKSDEVIKTKDEKIALLETELLRMKENRVDVKAISAEAYAQHPELLYFTVGKSLIQNFTAQKADTLYNALMAVNKPLKNEDQQRMYNWLKARLKADSLVMSVQYEKPPRKKR